MRSAMPQTASQRQPVQLPELVVSTLYAPAISTTLVQFVVCCVISNISAVFCLRCFVAIALAIMIYFNGALWAWVLPPLALLPLPSSASVLSHRPFELFFISIAKSTCIWTGRFDKNVIARDTVSVSEIVHRNERDGRQVVTRCSVEERHEVAWVHVSPHIMRPFQCAYCGWRRQWRRRARHGTGCCHTYTFTVAVHIFCFCGLRDQNIAPGVFYRLLIGSYRYLLCAL